VSTVPCHIITSDENGSFFHPNTEGSINGVEIQHTCHKHFKALQSVGKVVLMAF
jgi:hypothetical protein